jgi:hypothetical protein
MMLPTSQCARSRRLGERLTVHPDGSCDYLFQPEEVRTLFAAARLRCVELHTQHTQHPRHRLWLRGTFQLDTAAGGGTLQGRNDGCGEMMQGVTSLTQACPPSKQQQQSTSMPPRRVAPGLLSGTWLTGAAGRLALHASELPGDPHGWLGMGHIGLAWTGFGHSTGCIDGEWSCEMSSATASAPSAANNCYVAHAGPLFALCIGLPFVAASLLQF